MSSNLASLGFDVESPEEFDALVRAVLPRATVIGSSNGREFLRWEDPSGVRLAFERSSRGVERFVPSFAGRPGATVADVARLNDAAWMVDVVDAEGELATRAAVDLELGDLYGPSATARRATVVALGNAVRAYPTAEAFEDSDDSLLAPGAEPSEAPPHFAERGWKWPPRVGAESFMSYGAFGDAATAAARGRMYGTVVSAEERTNVYTGVPFQVVRTRTVGMEVDLCLERLAERSLPATGNIVGGDVYLVVALEPDDGHGAPRPSPSLLARLGFRKH